MVWQLDRENRLQTLRSQNNQMKGGGHKRDHVASHARCWCATAEQQDVKNAVVKLVLNTGVRRLHREVPAESLARSPGTRSW